jgi:hypothetical protein
MGDPSTWNMAAMGSPPDGVDVDISNDPNDKTLIHFVVRLVQKKDTEDKFYRFFPHCGDFPLSKDQMEFEHDFPLLKGQKLADVLTINVKPGLYKIGSPVRLGSIRLDSDHPYSLMTNRRKGEYLFGQPKK